MTTLSKRDKLIERFVEWRLTYIPNIVAGQENIELEIETLVLKAF